MAQDLINKRITTIVLPLGKIKVNAASSKDKKAAFDNFIKEIFGADGVEKDPVQFIELIAKLLEYVKDNKLLKPAEFTAFDSALTSFKDKINKGDKLAINTKDLFETLCFLIMKKDNIDKEAKIECLIGLTAPLSKCVEGAQGEIQSRIMTLNATSLPEQLSAFAKSLLEDSAYKELIKHGYKLDDAIHTRNNFLMIAHDIGVEVIGKQPIDQYTGYFTRSEVIIGVHNTIDQLYTVNKFIDSICTTMVAYIADLNLQITEKYKLEKLYKFSEYYGIDAKNVDVMLGFKCEMPYSEMSNLLQRIYLRDDEEDDKKITFRYIAGNNLITEPISKNILLIRNNNGAITFTINKNTYSIISQDQHPELFAKFVALLEDKPDIENIANFLISSEFLNSSKFREFDADFFRYEVLKTMEAQNLLFEKPANIKNSIFLKNPSYQATLVDYTHIVTSNPDYSCIILPLETSLEIFVEKNGEYLQLADACRVGEVKEAIKHQLQILAGYDSLRMTSNLMSQLVKNEFGPVFNTDIISILSGTLQQRLGSCHDLSDCAALLFDGKDLNDEQRLYNTQVTKIIFAHVKTLRLAGHTGFLEVKPSGLTSTIQQLRVLYLATKQGLMGEDEFVSILEKTPLAYNIIGSEKEFSQEPRLWNILGRNLNRMDSNNSLCLLQRSEALLAFKLDLAQRKMLLSTEKDFERLTDILTEDNNKNLLQEIFKDAKNIHVLSYLNKVDKTYLPKLKFEKAIAFLAPNDIKYSRHNSYLITYLLNAKLNAKSSANAISPLNNVSLELMLTTLVQDHSEQFFNWLTENLNHRMFKKSALVKIITASQKFKDALNANINLIQFSKTHKNSFETYKDWVNLMQLDGENNILKLDLNLRLVRLMLQNVDIYNQHEVEGVMKFFVTNSNLSENIISTDRKLLEGFKYKLQRDLKPKVIDRVNLFRKKTTDNSEQIDFYIRVIDKFLNPPKEVTNNAYKGKNHRPN